jgi:hypothetical protein
MKLNIDKTNPFWIELCTHIKKVRHRHLEPSNWYIFVEYFTTGQLAQFNEFYPGVEKYQMHVVNGLLESKSETQDKIQKLETLRELWDYDYSKVDHIGSCLILKKSDRALYQYFLDCGSTFVKEHCKYIDSINTDILSLMVENGIELDAIGTALITAFNKKNTGLMQKLRYLVENGVDVAGQLLELPKVSVKNKTTIDDDIFDDSDTDDEEYDDE